MLARIIYIVEDLHALITLPSGNVALIFPPALRNWLELSMSIWHQYLNVAIYQFTPKGLNGKNDQVPVVGVDLHFLMH